MRHVSLSSILIWTLIMIGSPATVGADVIMTLEATSGSLGSFQDFTLPGSVSGPGFNLSFGSAGSAFPISLAHGNALSLQPGQLIDQSGELLLHAPFVIINGQDCCAMSGIVNIAAIPAAAIPGSRMSGPPTVNVTAPFTASGTLRTQDTLTLGQGPFGDYFFKGTGTMTSEFRASCGTVNEPSCYFWNSSALTFAPTVPESSAWLLLASGLVVLFLSRRRLMSQANPPPGCS